MINKPPPLKGLDTHGSALDESLPPSMKTPLTASVQLDKATGSLPDLLSQYVIVESLLLGGGLVLGG